MSQSKAAARYDSFAQWYDEYLGQALYDPIPDHIRRLVGEGEGLCVDVGCGTGVHLQTLARLGWSVVGVDLSADQLGIARTRFEGVIRADAGRLPIASGAAARCVSVLTLTDFDDVGPFFAEAARILQPDGQLVVITTHPCFIGPFAKTEGGSDGTIQIFPGYRNTERVFEGPGLGSGIRSRVGVRHVPMAELLNKLIGAGLRLLNVEELGDGTIPWVFSLVASTHWR
jgi:SAM-dependent methyltransferase